MRLVICDGNRILSEALASVLEARGHKVVEITTNVAEGLAAAAAHGPEAIVLDPRFPEDQGRPGRGWREVAGAAELMRKQCPGASVLLLTSLTDHQALSAAMKAGVAGLLRKDVRAGEVADALDVIARGGSVFDPRLARQQSLWRRQAGRARQRRFYLTPREKEVLRRIVAGQSTAQMAEEMNVTISTLRGYVKNLLTKLGAHSRLQAAALATRGGLLDEAPLLSH